MYFYMICVLLRSYGLIEIFLSIKVIYAESLMVTSPTGAITTRPQGHLVNCGLGEPKQVSSGWIENVNNLDKIVNNLHVIERDNIGARRGPRLEVLPHLSLVTLLI